MQKCRFDF